MNSGTKKDQKIRTTRGLVEKIRHKKTGRTRFLGRRVVYVPEEEEITIKKNTKRLIVNQNYPKPVLQNNHSNGKNETKLATKEEVNLKEGSVTLELKEKQNQLFQNQPKLPSNEEVKDAQTSDEIPTHTKSINETPRIKLPSEINSDFLKTYGMVKINNPKQLAARTNKVNAVQQSVFSEEIVKQSTIKDKSNQIFESRVESDSFLKKCEEKEKALSKILHELRVKNNTPEKGKVNEDNCTSENFEDSQGEPNEIDSLLSAEKEKINQESSPRKVIEEIEISEKTHSLSPLNNLTNSTGSPIRNSKTLLNDFLLAKKVFSVTNDHYLDNILSADNEITITTKIIGGTVEKTTIIRAIQGSSRQETNEQTIKMREKILSHQNQNISNESQDKKRVIISDCPPGPRVKINKTHSESQGKSILNKKTKSNIKDSLNQIKYILNKIKKTKKKRPDMKNKFNLQINWNVEEIKDETISEDNSEPLAAEKHANSENNVGAKEETRSNKSNKNNESHAETKSYLNCDTKTETLTERYDQTINNKTEIAVVSSETVDNNESDIKSDTCKKQINRVTLTNKFVPYEFDKTEVVKKTVPSQLENIKNVSSPDTPTKKYKNLQDYIKLNTSANNSTQSIPTVNVSDTVNAILPLTNSNCSNISPILTMSDTRTQSPVISSSVNTPSSNSTLKAGTNSGATEQTPKQRLYQQIKKTETPALNRTQKIEANGNASSIDRSHKQRLFEQIKKQEQKRWCKLCKKSFASTWTLKVHCESMVHKREEENSIFGKDSTKQNEKTRTTQGKRTSANKNKINDEQTEDNTPTKRRKILIKISKDKTIKQNVANNVKRQNRRSLRNKLKTDDEDPNEIPSKGAFTETNSPPNNIEKTEGANKKSTKKIKDVPSEHYCDICKLEFESKFILNKHFVTNMHRTAAQIYVKQMEKKGIYDVVNLFL